jgi:hypothetical protein
MTTSASVYVTLYWGAVDEPGPSALRNSSFTAQAGGLQSYTLNLAGQAGWRGMINSVRLTFQSTPNVNVNIALQSIQFNPTSAAAVATSKSQLVFTAALGSSSPSPQTISINGTTNSSLPWNATSGAPWLALSSASGTAPSNLVASINPSGLMVGVHNAAITITSPGAGNSPLTIPVSLWVIPIAREAFRDKRTDRRRSTYDKVSYR